MTDNLLLEPNSIPVPVNLASLLRDHLKTRCVGAAIFLQQLHYWTQKECGRIIDGVRWIWNTYKGWLKNFPCLSEWDFRIITKKLRELELILFCQPNDHERDRTGHYRLNYEHEWLKPLLTHHHSHNNECTNEQSTTASEDYSPDIKDTTSENSSDSTTNGSVEKKENEQEIKDAIAAAPFMQSDEETGNEETGDEETEDKETGDEGQGEKGQGEKGKGTRDTHKSHNNHMTDYLRRLRLLRVPTLYTVENKLRGVSTDVLNQNILALEEFAATKGLDKPLAAFFACIKDNWQPKNDKQAWWTAAAAALGREKRDKLIRHIIEIDGVLTVCFSNKKILPFDEAKALDWDALSMFGGES